MSQADFVTRGQALVTSGQYQEAVKVCRLGLLGRPTTVEGRVVLGQALFALGRYDEVLAEMRVALELDHTSVIAQLLKAEALIAKGDLPAANEVLARVQPIVPADAERLGWLRGEVQRSGGRKPLTASHPAVGFVGGTSEATSEGTKNYLGHGADEEDTEPKDVDDAPEVPTSVSTPGPVKRSARQQAMSAPNPTPSPDVLAVGDKSGTMEVDPEADGIELEPDDDFGDIAQPPPGRTPAQVDGARGSVKRSSRRDLPARRRKPDMELSSVELDSDEIEVIEEAPARPGPGTAVRNAVMMPSGPLDPQAGHPAAHRPTAHGFPAPIAPPLAQRIAQQPHVMQVSPLPGPLPARSAIASAMPTAAAQPMPARPAHLQPTISPHAQVPSLTPAQVSSAAAMDALFGADAPAPPHPGSHPVHAGAYPAAPEPSGPGPAWAKATMVAGHHVGAQDGRAAAEHDPRGSARDSQGSMAASMSVASVDAPSVDGARAGRRRPRSKFAVAMWILAGILVIGGGVFAGFQIRAMRLEKQIDAAREQAISLAKADTWQGWAGARDRIAGIARASSTVTNRAALARARAVLAYEFGDGIGDARASIDKLGDRGGLDAAIAAAYVGLVQADPDVATAAATRAATLAADDPAVRYVVGQAALLTGDYKAAITKLREAHEGDPRPLYAVGLARAIAATGAWDDALKALDQALGAMPDHPAALIERALVLSRAGRIVAGAATVEIRTQLVKLIDEGGRKLTEQTRGVSPAQVALANLALARIDFALRDPKAAKAEIKAALEVGADEPRFATEAIETLYWFGELQSANAGLVVALASWPKSSELQATQAQVALTMGGPTEAINVLKRSPQAAALPRGLAILGRAKLAIGDVPGAQADLDAALKVLPALDVAVIGRAWVALAQEDPAYARKLVTPKYDPAHAHAAMATVYAAILRKSGELDMAKQVLEKTISGPATVEMPGAQLELGRVLRELGDMRGARTALQDSIRVNPILEAKLEIGLLMIEDRDPIGGRDTINEILDKEPNAMSNPRVVLEGARARMLGGDHVGAGQLLEVADQLPGVQRWVLDRERGRLALRRGDVPTAAKALGQALDGAGSDGETFLLAAELVTVDPTQTTELAAKLESLVKLRLDGAAEALIVRGKLQIAAGNNAEATIAYEAARKALGNTTPRRLAQAYFGEAVIAYYKDDGPTAQDKLDLVLQADPSIYGAYLFAATLRRTKASTAVELARKAVTFNPDSVGGWYVLGLSAAKVRKTKDLDEAIERLTALAPSGPELTELRGLR